MLTEETRQKMRENGRKGGLAKVKKGFATNPERAKAAQAKSAESRRKRKALAAELAAQDEK